MEKINDEKLFLKVIKENDHEAMEILIYRYNKLIYKYIYDKIKDYYLAQDLCQEVFIKVYKNRNSYNKDYAFKSWLYRIAHNCVIDYVRSRTYKNQQLSSENMDHLSNNNSSNVIEYKLLQDEINHALKDLKQEQQEVVKLRFYQEFSLKEIAYITESNINTVKARLYTGIKYLKQALKKDYGGDTVEKAK